MLRAPTEPLPGQQITAADYAALARYVKHITPRSSPKQRVRIGSGGYTRRTIQSPFYPPAPLGGGITAWNWKVYNTTTPPSDSGNIGQVQINGGDGFEPSLNSLTANVNGGPANVKTDGAYPQLAIGGNGDIYFYAVPATAGTASPLSSLDIYYGYTSSPDTAVPATYAAFRIATISNYAVDGSGNVSFDVSNDFTAGPAILVYCMGAVQIY